jgi:Transcriptional regulator
MEKSEIEGLWTHIHWLSVLEEHGTYTAAAARLGVSKSAVSQRISDLEKATGTRLVDPYHAQCAVDRCRVVADP